MQKVGIVTDSTNCLPPELIQELGIRVVPVGMVINGKVYRDQVDIDLAGFRKLSENLEEQPSTAAGNPADFLAVFQELSETTDKILCILVSKALTATHESAYLAKRMIRQEKPDLRIEVLDSRTSAGALGFIVLEAARAAEAEKDWDQVIEVARGMILRVIYLASLDSLDYLIRIGRAPKSTSLGEALNVKPIIGFVDDTGLVEVVSRVRGKRKALETLAKLIQRYVDAKGDLHVMVHHMDGAVEAEELKDLITSRYRCVEVYTSEYTPVMLSAVGPMIGLAAYV